MADNINESSLMKALGWAYDQAVNNIPLIGSSRELGEQYLKENNYNKEEAIDSLIRWQTSKAGLAGFATGLGGLITLPVTLPADITTCLCIEMRLVSAIAHICGYDVNSPEVRALCFVTLCGDKALSILKDLGIEAVKLGVKTFIKSISGHVIAQINKAVGFRLVTKFGSKGVINLGRAIPLVGGIVGGALDSTFTYGVGKAAKAVFYKP